MIDWIYRMEHPEHHYHPQFLDYSEKRSLPITVPDYRHIHQVPEMLLFTIVQINIQKFSGFTRRILALFLRWKLCKIQTTPAASCYLSNCYLTLGLDIVDCWANTLVRSNIFFQGFVSVWVCYGSGSDLKSRKIFNFFFYQKYIYPL